MQSTELDVLSQVFVWLKEGQPSMLFTTVRTWGSAPRPLNSLLAINIHTGSLSGSVSGGCVEDDLRERVLNGEILSIQSIRYGITREQTEKFGLPCGGVLEIVAEPLTEIFIVQILMDALQKRQLIEHTVHLSTQEVKWQLTENARDLQFDGETLTTVYGAIWQLLIIGAGQLSYYVAQFAKALNYKIIICDPRVEYREQWHVDGTTINTQMPDDAVLTHVTDARSAVVTLTHDPKLDDMALLEALRSPAFYVGALGSKLSSAKRRERLAALELPLDAIARLHAPIGLSIGSRTPPEIALSILAEITALRHGIQLSTV